MRPHPLYPGAALCFALVAFLEKPIAARRPAPPELGADVRFVVTSPLDQGHGSLREAIFAADRARGRARIEIRSGPQPIRLETPLPPLANPEGVVVEAPAAGVEIDAAGLPAGAVLDLDSPRSSIRGLRFRGAAGRAILVRSRHASLSGLAFADCEEGVHVLEGASDVVVEGSVFERNGTGIGIDPGVPSVHIGPDNRFRGHDRGAVWSVSPVPAAASATPELLVRQNQFEDDRVSLILINVAARVEENRVLRPVEIGAYVTGAPVLRGNRVDGAESVGLYGDELEGGALEENEVSNSRAIGLLVRHSRNARLRGNKVFGNAYGIAVFLDREGAPNVVSDNLVLNQRIDGLFVVGASPVLERNRVVGSGGAGLHVLDYVPLRGPRLAGQPLLRENVFRDNKADEARGEYREPPQADGTE
jgi:parallel beta-helix repeat protein